MVCTEFAWPTTRCVPLYGLPVLLDLVCDIAVLVFDLPAGLLVAQIRVCAVVAREPAAELADQHDRPRRLRRARPAAPSKPQQQARAGAARTNGKQPTASKEPGLKVEPRDVKSERVRVCVLPADFCVLICVNNYYLFSIPICETIRR